jgi:hypothetical protein
MTTIRSSQMEIVQLMWVNKTWKTMKMRRRMMMMKSWRKMTASSMISLMSLESCLEKNY